MSNEQETIEDIVAAMRNEGHTGDASCLEWVGAKIRGYADRIEAAAKREREAGAEAAQVCGEICEMIGREATREKASRVGNAAKMREALVKAKKAICHHAKYVCQSLSWENSDIQSNCGDILCAHRDLCEAKTAINAALAESTRNCDIGNALEQVSRHRIWCKCGGACAVSCKMCFAKWSQMPYEEGGAK